MSAKSEDEDSGFNKIDDLGDYSTFKDSHWISPTTFPTRFTPSTFSSFNKDFSRYGDFPSIYAGSSPENENWILEEPEEPFPDYDDVSQLSYHGKQEHNPSKSDSKTSESNKLENFKAIIQRFADKTSMTGVTYIRDANLPIARFIWVVLLLSAVGAMIFHLHFLFKQFYSRPKQTKVSLGFSNLPIPSVTVCNMNPIRKSQLHLASKELQDLIKFSDPRRFMAKFNDHTNPMESTTEFNNGKTARFSTQEDFSTNAMKSTTVKFNNENSRRTRKQDNYSTDPIESTTADFNNGETIRFSTQDDFTTDAIKSTTVKNNKVKSRRTRKQNDFSTDTMESTTAELNDGKTMRISTQEDFSTDPMESTTAEFNDGKTMRFSTQEDLSTDPMESTTVKFSNEKSTRTRKQDDFSTDPMESTTAEFNDGKTMRISTQEDFSTDPIETTTAEFNDGKTMRFSTQEDLSTDPMESTTVKFSNEKSRRTRKQDDFSTDPMESTTAEFNDGKTMRISTQEDLSTDPMESTTVKFSNEKSRRTRKQDDFSTDPMETTTAEFEDGKTMGFSTQEDFSTHPMETTTTEFNDGKTMRFSTHEDFSTHPMETTTTEFKDAKTMRFSTQEDFSTDPMESTTAEFNNKRSRRTRKQDDSSTDPMESTTVKFNYAKSTKSTTRENFSTDPVDSTTAEFNGGKNIRSSTQEDFSTVPMESTTAQFNDGKNIRSSTQEDFSTVPMESITTTKKRKLRTTTSTVKPGSNKGNNNGKKNRTRRFVDELKNYNFTEDPADASIEFKDRDPLSELKKTYRRLYMKQSRETRIRMGHRLSDMLIQCSIAGRKCRTRNFQTFPTADYGNCFTFNSKDVLIEEPGVNSGLQMILFMENDEYIHGITDGYGARVVIHNSDTFPFPMEEGFDVPAAFESNIGLKMVSIERLGHPFGECEEEDAFIRNTGVGYSLQACLILCRARLLAEICGCVGGKDQEYLIKTNYTISNVCTTPEERKCFGTLRNRAVIKENECNCQQPCKEKQYTKFVSTRQYPTNEYAYMLLQGICEKSNSYCSSLKKQLGDIRQLNLNFLKIGIYYEDLNYENIKEEPEIEDAQFASDVGGAIGLWIGLTILSIFEFLQLLVEICKFFVFKT